MRKLVLALFFAVVGVLAYQSGSTALTTTQYTTKPVMVTVTITPSPAPVGFFHAPPAQPVPPPAQVALVSDRDRDALEMEFARYVAPPTDSSFGTAPVQVAQVQNVPGGNVPVNIKISPDPTAAYLHITPVTPNLNAVYGVNTYTCVYRVFGYFTKQWKIDDWVYGTTSTGGSAGFPGNGYPTASAVSWLAEGITTTYTPFTNAGQPGQLTFNGVANVSQNVCIDLQITVAPSIPPGVYSFPATYALFVTF